MTSGSRLPDSTFCSSVHEDDQADLVLRELLVGEAQRPARIVRGHDDDDLGVWRSAVRQALGFGRW
jgi:hypothetical protein